MKFYRKQPEKIELVTTRYLIRLHSTCRVVTTKNQSEFLCRQRNLKYPHHRPEIALLRWHKSGHWRNFSLNNFILPGAGMITAKHYPYFVMKELAVAFGPNGRQSNIRGTRLVKIQRFAWRANQ